MSDTILSREDLAHRRLKALLMLRGHLVNPPSDLIDALDHAEGALAQELRDAVDVEQGRAVRVTAFVAVDVSGEWVVFHRGGDAEGVLPGHVVAELDARGRALAVLHGVVRKPLGTQQINARVESAANPEHG